PITYVNRVTAPVLIIAGENDSRCPIGQVMRYVDALRERGGRVDVHLYGTGHHALFLEETLRQIEEELTFALQSVRFDSTRDSS
ncbi:MAG: prolyl oligopeptidase family serine peptidase, partial [Actinobacteria bacterium]|nr:prolyl oligopeptidase family serine peptidase [Actinomycetota bacterium]